MSTRVMTAHIPLELAEKVDKLAAQYERPRGWVIKQALKDWVSLEERRYRETLEAIADIEREGTIPHEEMVRWAESLGGPNPLPPPQPRK
jgi:predicted transcriptional regulator